MKINNKDIVLQVYLLSGLFGMGSWIAVTGLWLEMPLMMRTLPEKWRLASQLNVMIQLANVGPLIYWAVKRLPFVNDISATHVQMIVGMLSSVALIFAWDQTLVLFGDERSVVLFIATFGLALVDCTSSVTFLTFMARFDSSYMTPYLVGEGLSGFFPSMVALIQGVGEDNKECNQVETNSTNSTNETTAEFEPRFSAEIFFLSLLITLFISYVAFCCLHFLPICKREMSSAKQEQEQISENDQNVVSIETHNGQTKLNEGENLVFNSKVINEDENKANQQSTYYYLLALMGWNCFTTFGFFPSIQPYAALPYGASTLHYVVILAGLAYPVGCFLGMIWENKNVRAIYFVTGIGSAIGAYIVLCALMSPSPPLAGTTAGSVVTIAVWISFVTILSYSKAMICLWVCDYNSEKGMFWVGMTTQFGSALGAGLNFLLVNYTSLFHEC